MGYMGPEEFCFFRILPVLVGRVQAMTRTGPRNYVSPDFTSSGSQAMTRTCPRNSDFLRNFPALVGLVQAMTRTGPLIFVFSGFFRLWLASSRP